MSKNPEYHLFTDETLRKHDLEIAAKVHQATVLSVIRKMNDMNTGQQLNAQRESGRSLYWSEEKLNKVLDNIE